MLISILTLVIIALSLKCATLRKANTMLRDKNADLHQHLWVELNE